MTIFEVLIYKLVFYNVEFNLSFLFLRLSNLLNYHSRYQLYQKSKKFSKIEKSYGYFTRFGQCEVKSYSKKAIQKVLLRKHNTRSASGPTGCTGVQLRSQKGLINSS